MDLLRLLRTSKPGAAFVDLRARSWRPFSKVQSAWRRTNEGYTIEFFIPAAQLLPGRMLSGEKMGVNYALSEKGTAH